MAIDARHERALSVPVPLTHWSARYIGLPFVDLGRDVEAAGVDCYGLLRAVLLHEAGVELSAHDELGPKDMMRAARALDTAASEFPWKRVDEPKEFDAVLMRAAGGNRANTHCGVMADGGRVLHTTAATGSVLVPLTHLSIRSRIAGFYRHADLQ